MGRPCSSDEGIDEYDTWLESLGKETFGKTGRRFVDNSDLRSDLRDVSVRTEN